ncbi:MAG: multiple sugar transport system substrate-binding protein [Patescibacteria group bacterium]|jgi:ABC-type glycerol-3-phosphate transport system substrate-binding protein|nr:multiple sugar transport system substrate-binding protein [Patescibacteria group bacterium]
MDSRTSIVQIIVLGVFIFLGILGVVVFAGFGSAGKNSAQDVTINLWGVLPKDSFAAVIESFNLNNPGYFKINYTEKSLSTIESDLNEAIIDKNPPDALLIPENILFRNQKKLSLISWSALPEREFLDTFVESGEVFKTSEGTYGIPFLIDPIVMYWNRDVFSSASKALPPKTWDDVIGLIPVLSKISEDKKISRSMIPLGEFQNVSHAKEIIFALAHQAGSKMLVRDKEQLSNQLLSSIYNDAAFSQDNPFEIVLNFFTQFSDPTKPAYSWNRSLENSGIYFSKGNSATYLGFASELPGLRAKNPNLNFDVAEIPQSKNADLAGGRKATFAHVYSLVIVGDSPYKQASYNEFMKLTSPEVSERFAQKFSVAPSRRDLLARGSNRASEATVWNSALFAKSFLDPDPFVVSSYLKDMVESIITGKVSSEEATQIFSREIDELIRK